ncbi:MAG TPA: hypothetical protein ENK08_03740 [Chloroflexi bacterium]|nr:hypothetical protein [Chloroflexota bacterium]
MERTAGALPERIRRFKEQGNHVREAVAGYARAAALVERERMDRLARMTPEEARAIYDALCRSRAGGGQGHNLERLERWRWETLLAVREAMALLSRRISSE